MIKILHKRDNKMKRVLLITTLAFSVNASADFFSDVGDWVSDNKTVTAIVGVGALTAAAVAVKPLSAFFTKEAGAVALEAGAAAETGVRGFARLAQGGATEIEASGILADFEVIESEAATGTEMLSGAEATANKTNMLEADANLIAGEADRDAFFARLVEQENIPMAESTFVEEEAVVADKGIGGLSKAEAEAKKAEILKAQTSVEDIYPSVVDNLKKPTGI